MSNQENGMPKAPEKWGVEEKAGEECPVCKEIHSPQVIQMRENLQKFLPEFAPRLAALLSEVAGMKVGWILHIVPFEGCGSAQYISNISKLEALYTMNELIKIWKEQGVATEEMLAKEIAKQRH